MRIDQEQMENSLFYLASTDEEYARARTYFNGLDRQLKTVKALAFRTSDESSVFSAGTRPCGSGRVSHCIQTPFRHSDL